MLAGLGGGSGYLTQVRIFAEWSVERIMTTARNTLIVLAIVGAVVLLVLLFFGQYTITSGGGPR